MPPGADPSNLWGNPREGSTIPMPVKAPAREPPRTTRREAATAVSVSAISKAFEGRDGPVAALHDVSFAAAAGETLGIVGPSGCGKSTLLEIVAGLEPASKGD